MNIQRLSAILLIAGSIGAFVMSVLIPPGLYATSDPQARVQIIEAYRTRWMINQILGFVFFSLTAAGYAVLAWRWRGVERAWVPGLGAGLFVIGTLVGMVFLYRQTVDPLGGYGGVYSGLEVTYYWLALAAMVLFGVACLQAGLPGWVGYVTLGLALIYGAFFLITGAGFVTPWIVALLSLVIALSLLRKISVLQSQTVPNL